MQSMKVIDTMLNSCIAYSQHSTRWHGMKKSMRMEVEELEQLNPAIKGKRLEVVDEVCLIAWIICICFNAASRGAISSRACQ